MPERLTFPILMNQNENPLGPSPGVSEILVQRARFSHRYEFNGNTPLIDKLEHQVREVDRGESLSILLGCGADHLLSVCCYFALRNSGGEIIEPEFSYHRATEIVNDMTGQAGYPAQVVHSAMTEGLAVDLGAILDKINNRTRAIFLTNPNNPTGLVIGLKDIEPWLKKIPGRIMVVIDEAYIHFYQGLQPSESLRLPVTYPNLFLIRTFSKIYGLASLRLGYGVGNTALVQQLSAWNGAEPGALAQAAGLAALKDQDHFLASYHLACEFKEEAKKAFAPYGTVILPSQTNFILFQWKDQTEKIAQGLKEKGIQVALFNHQPAGPWLRASMGTPQENRYFISTCRTLMEKNLT